MHKTMSRLCLFLALLLCCGLAPAATQIDRLDGISASVAVKAPVKVATTGNITLSGTQTIDGVAVGVDDRVLVKNQTTVSQNGVYSVQAAAWERAKDFDGNRDIVKGTLVMVTDGSTNSNTYWRVSASNPIVIGTTSITFERASSNDAASVFFLQSGTGAIPYSLQTRLRDSLNPLDFGAICDGTSRALSTVYSTLAAAQVVYPHATALTNELDWAAIQAALNAAGARSTDGAVELPTGNCRTNLTLSPPYGVSMLGHGGTVSTITAADVDGITISYYTGYNHAVFDNFGIYGSGGTTRTGFKQPGTLNEADQTYGLTLSRLLIKDFNVGISFRTVWFFNLNNNWLQNVNTGIDITGQCIVGHITNNKVVKASGNGTGVNTGIVLTAFNYTSGVGQAFPEGIRVTDNLLYGFETAANFSSCLSCTLHGSDILATLYGVRFSTITGFIPITNNHIEVTGGTNAVGVWGPAQNTVINSVISITGNYILASGGTTGSGILLGTLGVGGNVDNVTIGNNSFGGWTSSDVEIFSSGNVYVHNNLMNSNVGGNPSLNATSIPANRPVYVWQNKMSSTITYDAADLQTGRLQLGPNLVSNTTRTGWALFGSGTFNPSNLADGAGETTTLTVAGVALGDYVEGVSFSLDLQGITLTAYVSAADTVAIRFQNESSGAIDLASGTLRVKVRQKDTGT